MKLRYLSIFERLPRVDSHSTEANHVIFETAVTVGVDNEGGVTMEGISVLFIK